jgi:serine/threonine protein kinase
MSLDRVARVFEHRLFRERYDVIDRIGSGSFAQVYRAVQRSTGQDVAVKILTLDDRPDADPIQLQIARFKREVQLCAYLRHPNIVSLMDSGQPSSEIIYAIFEYVPGWNLADVLAIEGRTTSSTWTMDPRLEWTRALLTTTVVPVRSGDGDPNALEAD